MYSIELMVQEHENIRRLLAVVRAALLELLDGEDVNDGDFRSIIDFIRNYADKHHHGKEEKILFVMMTEHLGKIATNLVKHGMLVEHDLARFHVMELEKALDSYKADKNPEAKLDIIIHAGGYADLLDRHIEKENDIVYTYAENNLSSNLLKSVDNSVSEFESEAKKHKVQIHYLELLTELEEKYIK